MIVVDCEFLYFRNQPISSFVIFCSCKSESKSVLRSLEMEGNRLIFSIMYNRQEHVLELSEYDTVEDLKMEVYRVFKVDVVQQHITGWCNVPVNDHSILQGCAQKEINSLIVTESTSISRFENDQIDQYSYPSYSAMEHSGSDYKVLEIAAIASLKRKLPSNISSIIRQCSLSDAIESMYTGPINERKSILLYLHNSEDPFSQIFLRSLTNEKVSAVLRKTFLVLGWDVEDSSYHCALKNALDRYDNLKCASDWVTNKIAVGMCILPLDNTITIFHFLLGNISLEQMIKNLTAVEAHLKHEHKENKETSIEINLDSEMTQKLWADMLGDRDYDAFELTEHELLKIKIGFALYGPPKEEYGYEERQRNNIESFFNVIKEQSRPIAEFNDHIELSFILNCLEPLPKEKCQKAKNDPKYNPKTDFNTVPVFVLRKCRGSENPCRIFIDINLRIYGSWTNYLEENKHPQCQMIVPRNGRYRVEDGKVLLETHNSPSSETGAKFLRVVDSVSAVAGVVSGGVVFAASVASLPLAAPIGLAVGAGTGIWSLVRTSTTLYDRSQHLEEMSVTNSEARGAYVNLVAGIFGFAGAGSNLALARSVSNGANIGRATIAAANTVTGLNFTAGLVALVNSGYDVFDQWFNEDQVPSRLTCIQLATSVLFFGHAVYNLKPAQTIIEETQARVLQDYQNSLRSNRHRKTFNRLMRETMSTHSDGTSARAEVIATVRNIQSKDQVFAALTRNTKTLSKSGIRYSAAGGEITFNGIAVDMNEFIGLNRKQSEIFLSNLAQENTSKSVTSSCNSTRGIVELNNSVQYFLKDLNIHQVNIYELAILTSKLLAFCQDDSKTQVVNAVRQAVHYVIRTLSKSLSETVDTIIPKYSQYTEFLRLGISYFSQKVDEFEKQYKMYENSGEEQYYHPLFQYLNPVYCKRIGQMFDFIVKNSYSGENLISSVLTEISEFFTAWILRRFLDYTDRKKKEESSKNSAHVTRKIHCSTCAGWYFSAS